MRHDTRDLPYEYKGKVTAIPLVIGMFCFHCGESLLDPSEAVRVSNAMSLFQKTVNAEEPMFFE